MTLIVGFKSARGFAICADSQETVGNWRISRQKLTPERCGAFDIVAAGAGNNGDLIDAFVQRLQENIARSEIASLPDLKLFIHGELLDFQRSEAVLYPRKERRMQFLIAARMHNDRSYAVWKTTASRLAEVRDLALVGWEEPLYEAIAKRLYRADLTLEQAELAAAYVLTIGEETSNFIRGPMTVAIVRDSEIRLETSNRVRQMVERLKEFESSINNLFLACAENTPPPLFERTLNEFKQRATELHRFESMMVSKVVNYVCLAPADQPEKRKPLRRNTGKPGDDA